MSVAEGESRGMKNSVPYILIRDNSLASSKATELLTSKGISFRAVTSDMCDRIAPSLIVPPTGGTHAGLEDISRFVNRIAHEQ